jgi:hypothetical protein
MPTGRLARRPIRKDASAETAAVLVIKSVRTSATQARYAVSVAQLLLLVLGQTQVPPESEIMDAFTEICNPSYVEHGKVG